ncbi:uncharacterized protein LOC114939980 [Nylanderia fulva]|uniref:uncharacterized protein LOC114939980 n=1 Tax=Nylanderia fulva TaxID=613905 RepID=UPI0010FB7242|nr:uncharacterized protein LOC114939980 [Nylanderia fulva]
MSASPKNTLSARVCKEPESIMKLHSCDKCGDISLIEAALPTKQTVLAQTARLFDPLGWLAPILVRAKLLIQSAWLQQLEWDAPLSCEDAAAWTVLEEELPSVELHGFSDASERAYAAVVYSRVKSGGLLSINLVVAKSKVAPLKRVSLPRLELCGTAFLSKLAEHVRLSLNLEKSTITLWTDSTVTLGWIRGHPSKWNTYVVNSVAEIHRDDQDARWRHVLGKENLADCVSRGVSPKKLLQHPLWWRGPEYLRHRADFWPDVGHLETADLPEQRPLRCHAATEKREPEELNRFFCLRRLLCVSAWIWRWRPRRLRSTDGEAVSAFLGPKELEAALSRWIRTLPARSSLRKMVFMLDDEGTLRVSGRLKHAILDADQQHPVILPPQSHLTHLVIDAAHRRTFHGGVQATLAHIRQRFWIPRRRQLVRRHIHSCHPCVRWRAATPRSKMGDLPRARVTPSRPFQHTGVDLAGPVWLRTTRGRGHKAYKGFLVVFVCFSSRAVHLEAVSDYTAEAFLAAFRRRGPTLRTWPELAVAPRDLAEEDIQSTHRSTIGALKKQPKSSIT